MTNITSTLCGQKLSPANGFYMDRLIDGMHTVMDRIVEVYDTLGVSLPRRRIIGTGTQPSDCEQLVVSFGSLEFGLIHSDTGVPGACNPPITVTFQIQIVRCAPTVDNRGNPPKPAAIEATTAAAARDAYILMEAACTLSLWDGAAVDANVSVDSPEGGMLAVTMSLTTLI